MNVTSEVIGNIIKNKDIFIEFQPIYSLNTKKIIGIEALARGRHQDRIVSPTYSLFEYSRKRRGIHFYLIVSAVKKQCGRLCRNRTAPFYMYVNFETSVF
jgi:EAL domain-containing protein (putative c-di-GMP-specific phosphodiesterase class I)